MCLVVLGVSNLEPVRVVFRAEKLTTVLVTGSTLALAYAQAHPTRVISLTLRGIFTVGHFVPHSFASH